VDEDCAVKDFDFAGRLVLIIEHIDTPSDEVLFSFIEDVIDPERPVLCNQTRLFSAEQLRRVDMRRQTAQMIFRIGKEHIQRRFSVDTAVRRPVVLIVQPGMKGLIENVKRCHMT